MGGNARGRGGERDVLHASRATGPVAVVEVYPFALEDEGSYAVLLGRLVVGRRGEIEGKVTYPALGDRMKCFYRHGRRRRLRSEKSITCGWELVATRGRSAEK